MKERKPYQSKYQTDIDAKREELRNRPDFTWDANQDAGFQAYKDRYIAGGKMAMEDTIGKTTALTGGYGNSYAQQAGQQTYDKYLLGMNDKATDFYNMALQRYMQEGDDMMRDLGLLQQQDNTDYDRWLQGQQADRADEQFQYQQEQDKLAGDRWQMDFNFRQEQAKQDQANWEKQWEENLRRYEESKAPRGSGGGGGGRGSSGSNPSSTDAYAGALNAAQNMEQVDRILQQMIADGIPKEDTFRIRAIYEDKLGYIHDTSDVMGKRPSGFGSGGSGGGGGAKNPFRPDRDNRFY